MATAAPTTETICQPPLKCAAVGSIFSPSSQMSVFAGTALQTESASVFPARANEPPPSIAAPPPSCEPKTMMTAVGTAGLSVTYIRRFPPIPVVTLGLSGPSYDHVELEALFTPKVM